MFLIRGGRSNTGERHHVFVDVRPQAETVPTGCSVVEDVSLTAHPPVDDPDAPTLRVILYRDPIAPTHYHYLLSPSQAKHLKRAGGSSYVFHSWDEFVEMHPSVVAEMAG